MYKRDCRRRETSPRPTVTGDNPYVKQSDKLRFAGKMKGGLSLMMVSFMRDSPGLCVGLI